MRGRKPKPTVLKVLSGNPGKRPLNDREPKAQAGIPEPLPWLDAEAQAEWRRVEDILTQAEKGSVKRLSDEDLLVEDMFLVAQKRSPGDRENI